MKNLEKIYDTLSMPELLVILGTGTLLLTSHSQQFVERQKEIINKLDIRKIVKEICLEILNEIKIKENDNAKEKTCARTCSK